MKLFDVFIIYKLFPRILGSLFFLLLRLDLII